MRLKLLEYYVHQRLKGGIPSRASALRIVGQGMLSSFGLAQHLVLSNGMTSRGHHPAGPTCGVESQDYGNGRGFPNAGRRSGKEALREAYPG